MVFVSPVFDVEHEHLHRQPGGEPPLHHLPLAGIAVAARLRPSAGACARIAGRRRDRSCGNSGTLPSVIVPASSVSSAFTVATEPPGR